LKNEWAADGAGVGIAAGLSESDTDTAADTSIEAAVVVEAADETDTDVAAVPKPPNARFAKNECAGLSAFLGRSTGIGDVARDPDGPLTRGREEPTTMIPSGCGDESGERIENVSSSAMMSGTAEGGVFLGGGLRFRGSTSIMSSSSSSSSITIAAVSSH
jgi:hypothetical protein